MRFRRSIPRCIRQTKKGGPQDVEGALALLKSAVAKGHTASLRELAAMHDEGRHVPRDAKVAAQYLLDAARSQPGQSVLKARGDVWAIATRLELQRRLQAEGLYPGRISGTLDGATLKALLDYGLGLGGATKAAAGAGQAASPIPGQTRSPPFASGVIRSRLGVASLP